MACLDWKPRIPSQSDLARAEGFLRELLFSDAAECLADAYFDPWGQFAGAWFHRMEANDPDEFGESDLLALNLLDEALPPGAVRDLLYNGDVRRNLRALLHAVPNVDLDTAEDADLIAANRLWCFFEGKWKGLGAGSQAGRSKLLARKRPALVPIGDRVVLKSVPRGANDWWSTLWEILHNDSGLVERLDYLRRRVPVPAPTRIRVLDAVVWMYCSNNPAADAARAKCGAGPRGVAASES